MVCAGIGRLNFFYVAETNAIKRMKQEDENAVTIACSGSLSERESLSVKRKKQSLLCRRNLASLILLYSILNYCSKCVKYVRGVVDVSLPFSHFGVTCHRAPAAKQ